MARGLARDRRGEAGFRAAVCGLRSGMSEVPSRSHKSHKSHTSRTPRLIGPHDWNMKVHRSKLSKARGCPLWAGRRSWQGGRHNRPHALLSPRAPRLLDDAAADARACPPYTSLRLCAASRAASAPRGRTTLGDLALGAGAGAHGRTQPANNRIHALPPLSARCPPSRRRHRRAQDVPNQRQPLPRRFVARSLRSASGGQLSAAGLPPSRRRGRTPPLPRRGGDDGSTIGEYRHWNLRGISTARRFLLSGARAVRT